MRKPLFFLFFIVFSFVTIAQEAKRRISGKIAAEDGPLKNVNVRVKNTMTGVQTNGKGNYAIDAFIGDVLVFSYIGFHTVELTVDENNVYNLDMYPAVEELDEVIVRKKKEKAFSQKELLAEYPSNKNLIKTSRGILDKERASFSMRMVDGSEIVPIGMDFLTSLQAQFPTMVVQRDTFPLRVYFKRTGQYGASVLFDVDGFIYQDAPTFLIADEIDRIAVIQGNGAFARYGPAGAGGVIIINTKEKTRVDDLGVERKYNNADLMDSLVDNVNAKKKFAPIVADYIKEYKSAKSENRALEIYERQKKSYANFAPYFLDISNYFRNKWGNEEKSLEVLFELQSRFSKNIIALKALAYRYEELGQKEKALEVYLKILKIESKNAQSHRDVANAYAEVGNFKKALSNYARYELAVNSLDTVPFDKYGYDLLMTTEAHKIILVNGKELSLDNSKFQKDKTLGDNVRLLLEWNHPDAAFKLRVVSPDDYYDDWHAPPAQSIERIKGYYSKQFFLDDDFDGEWQIKINYMGSNEEAPIYLKATVFFDYGRPSQSMQSKVFKLQEKDIGMKLFSIFTDEKYIAP